jgi:hypothetical protein
VDNIRSCAVEIGFKEDEVGESWSANRGEKESIQLIARKARRKEGRLRRREIDNIKVDIVEVEWDGVDWIGLAQDRDNLRALV